MDYLSNFPKAGLTRLLKLFDNDNNTDNLVKLTKAFGLATRVHKGQLLNKDEPYINHPVRVALILAEELRIHDAELACAALLHDAPGSVQEESLKEYGERVYAIVRATVEPKTKPEEREKAIQEYFANLSKAPKDVRYVKLADRLDNIRAMKDQPFKDKVMRYKEETQKYAIPVAIITDDRLAFKLSIALYELK